MSKKISARIGAGTLAVATVVAGLSFGPAAANASTSAPASAERVAQVIFQAGSQFVGLKYGSYTTIDRIPGTTSFAKFSSMEAAQAGSPFLRIVSAGADRFRIQDPTTGRCIANYKTSSYGFSGCTDATSIWELDGDRLRSAGTDLVVVGANTGGILGLPGAQARNYLDVGDGSANAGLALVGDLDAFRSFAGAVRSVDVPGRSAVISGHGIPGAQVVVNGADEVTIGADGTWSYTALGLSLGEQTLTFEQRENGSKTGSFTVDVNLAVAPIRASVLFDTSDVQTQATIKGTAEKGASIEIRDADGKMIKAATADAMTGAWSTDLPAPNQGGTHAYDVRQVIDGDNGGEVSVTADFGAAVSIVTPAADSDHSGATRFQGRGVDGGTVELKDQKTGAVVGTATVAGGVWTISGVDVPERSTTFVATQTGKGNNVTTASVTLNPNAGGAQQPIVNPIADGSNVIIGTGGTPGATIIVRDKDGNEVGTAIVDPSGNWQVTVPPTLGPGKHDLDIVEVSDGNESDATRVVVDFGVAVDALTPSMAAPVKETRPVFTGTGQPGASVVIAGTRAEVARTTVGADGTWTATSTMELPAGDYRVTATQTTGIGVKSTDTIDFQRKNDAPVATPVKLVTPTTGSTIDTKRPTFTGTGHAGAQVEIRGTRATVATTTVKADGTWSVQSPVDLPNGDYRLFAEQTPQNGAAKSIDETTIKIAYRESAAVVVTGPTDTVATPVGHVTFTGTGDPNATITIAGTTAEVAKGVVGADGKFSITSTINFPAGDYRLIAKQDAQNGEIKQSASFLIKVRG